MPSTLTILPLLNFPELTSVTENNNESLRQNNRIINALRRTQTETGDVIAVSRRRRRLHATQSHNTMLSYSIDEITQLLQGLQSLQSLQQLQYQSPPSYDSTMRSDNFT